MCIQCLPELSAILSCFLLLMHALCYIHTLALTLEAVPRGSNSADYKVLNYCVNFEPRSIM